MNHAPWPRLRGHVFRGDYMAGATMMRQVRLLVLAMVLLALLTGGCGLLRRGGGDGTRRGSMTEACSSAGFYHISHGYDFGRFPLWYPFHIVELNRGEYFLDQVDGGGIIVKDIIEMNVGHPGMAFGVSQDPDTPDAGPTYFFLNSSMARPKVFASRETWEQRLEQEGVSPTDMVSPKTVFREFCEGKLPGCAPPDAWGSE